QIKDLRQVDSVLFSLKFRLKVRFRGALFMVPTELVLGTPALTQPRCCFSVRIGADKTKLLPQL
ncbi:MAG: hypothetical protein OXI81_15885, partial [Paracoccaceae bacterium]|nr:hypothetical protein [Paracoccaceae bacterium]